ncbi:MAG: hypothetical protein KAT70_08285 [Thermoplasmata archaeon]|nr:hypothetical protein [Thermoplasmata archaeon]
MKWLAAFVVVALLVLATGWYYVGEEDVPPDDDNTSDDEIADGQENDPSDEGGEEQDGTPSAPEEEPCPDDGSTGESNEDDGSVAEEDGNAGEDDENEDPGPVESKEEEEADQPGPPYKALILDAIHEQVPNDALIANVTTHLEDAGYNVTYKSDHEVTLDLIMNDLSGYDAVYFRTRRGCRNPVHLDKTVVSTGELWTSDVQEKYSEEYSNGWIIVGSYDGETFIAFTPGLIEHYYSSVQFPSGSLMYISACKTGETEELSGHFLNAGVSTYVGWSNWTHAGYADETSEKLMREICSGNATVAQVCDSTPPDPAAPNAELVYYGEGNLTLA